MRITTLLLIGTFLFCAHAGAQTAYIYSKEGRQTLTRKNLVNSCLAGLHKTRSDSTAVAICECQVNALDRRFTNKQFKQHTTNNIIDISGLVKEDSLLAKLEEACYTNSGKTLLLQAEGFENEFLKACATSIYSSTEKTLTDANVQSFCRCQLQMIKAKKLTDAQVHTLQNPNSLLFYEMMYTCGDPFTTQGEASRNWSKEMDKDITGT